MTEAEAVARLHEIAEEFVTASGRERADDTADDDLLKRYGFSSIDALEYLLIVEERFDVTFEDEDLTEDTVSSASRLASYIVSRSGAPVRES